MTTTKPTPTTAPDILDAAADYLEQNGWLQGDYLSSDGCACALGAIRLTAGGEVYDVEEGEPTVAGTYLSSIAVQAIDKHLGGQHLTAWNDEPERTADEVIAKLREAAAAERAGGAS